MRVLQDFNKADRNALRKYFIVEGQSLEFAYFESIIIMFEITYTLAKKEKYIKFIKNKSDLLELDMQQGINENFNKLVEILKEFNHIIQALRFYTLSLYVYEFIKEIDKEKEFWGEFQANPIMYLTETSDKRLNHQFLKQIDDLQHNLIYRFNSKKENEFEPMFINQLKAAKRNVNKNYHNFINNVETLLLTYKEIVVVELELCYMPRLRKGTLSFPEMKQHRKKFFNQIGKIFPLEFQYHGFAWQLKFNQSERIKFKTVLFFNSKVFIKNNINLFSTLGELWKEITNGHGFIKSDTVYSGGNEKDKKISNLQELKMNYVQVNDDATVQDLIQIGYEMTVLAFHLKPNLAEIKKLYEVKAIKKMDTDLFLKMEVNQTGDLSPPTQQNNDKKLDGNLFSMKIYINKSYNFLLN